MWRSNPCHFFILSVASQMYPSADAPWSIMLTALCLPPNTGEIPHLVALDTNSMNLPTKIFLSRAAHTHPVAVTYRTVNRYGAPSRLLSPVICCHRFAHFFTPFFMKTAAIRLWKECWWADRWGGRWWDVASWQCCWCACPLSSTSLPAPRFCQVFAQWRHSHSDLVISQSQKAGGFCL